MTNDTAADNLIPRRAPDVHLNDVLNKLISNPNIEKVVYRCGLYGDCYVTSPEAEVLGVVEITLTRVPGQDARQGAPQT